MKHVCMICGRKLGEYPGKGTSHGYCTPCAEVEDLCLTGTLFRISARAETIETEIHRLAPDHPTRRQLEARFNRIQQEISRRRAAS